MERYFLLILVVLLLKTAYAQNTGPNTIDYVGSQPPDATGMVTLPTGDFSYVLKLLDVPGPEGGFPVQLIYRSGVTVDQEASWVGLGWSLFPGAITRTVNGVPDDWYGKKVYNILKYNPNSNSFKVKPGNGLSGYASLGLQRLLGYNRSLFGYNNRTWLNTQLAVKYYSGPIYFKDALVHINSDNDDYGGIRFSNGFCMDTYSSFGVESVNIDDFNTLDADNGLIFPNYDQYIVNANGLSGIMTPRIHELSVLTGNGRIITQDGDGNATEEYSYHYNEDYDPICETSNNEMDFAFDFSHDSYLKVNAGNFQQNNTGSDPNTRFTLESEAGTLEDEIPESIQEYYDGISNYNETTKQRGGARHVEWFKNSDIVNNLQDAKDRGFIEAECLPLPDRSDETLFDPYGIGAFTITAADGTTYYFSLPVYQYEQFFRDQSVTTGDFYERRQLDKYAYAWLLTAITGPDYVDDGDNILNEADAGFWVKFTYGKWTDGYIWRTPYSDVLSPSGGYNAYYYINDDEIHKVSHWGRKQIYYLNSIVTRSHTAYFIKSLRDDALGKALSYLPVNFCSVKEMPSVIYEKELGLDTNKVFIQDMRYKTTVDITEAHETLKLDKIIVVENKDATLNPENITTLHSGINNTITFENSYNNVSPVGGSSFGVDSISITRNFTMYQEDNVIDINDLADEDSDNIPDIQEAAVKTVELEQDYSLAVGALNSNSSSGKLCLKKVKFKGTNNQALMPSYDFTYNNNNTYDFSNSWFDWGYVSQNEDAWSLNQIWTPEGGKLNIEYEPDDYQYKYAIINDSWSGQSAAKAGIRVKKIYVDDGKGNYYRTFYDYNIPSGYPESGESSGVTSYEPRSFYNIAYIQNLPMPEVLYGFVTVKNFGADYQSGDESDTETDEETIYAFDVPQKLPADMDAKQLKIGSFFNVEKKHGSDSQNIFYETSIIHDNTSAIGRSLAIISKNKAGHNINETYFIYFDRDSISGQFQESFLSRKLYYNESITPNKKWLLCNSSYAVYSNVLRGVISIDNGTPVTAENIKFDFNTGNVIEAAQGNSKTFVIPAYKKYPEMGPKSADITNKNMLSQVTASYAADKKDSITSIGIQTWKNNWYYLQYNPYISDYTKSQISGFPGIYKKYQSFAWNGDIKDNGTIKNYKQFNWAESEAYNESRGWKKTGEIDLYTKYSTPLNVQDVNGNFAANKYGYNDKYVIAGISNSNYRCFAYSGFENSKELSNGYTDYEGGFIDSEAETYSQLVSGAAHSGNYYLEIDGGHGPKFKMEYDSNNPELGLKTGTYRASVWLMESQLNTIKLEVIPVTGFHGSVTPADYTYNSSDPDKIKIGEWVLFSFEFTISGTLEAGDYVSICVTSNDGPAYIDDFRVYPVEAPMTATVIDSKTGHVSAVLDENNFATFYEYDEMGRLIQLKKETIKYGIQTVKEYNYHYARQY